MTTMDRTADMDATLTGQTDLAGFRSVARQLLAQQVAPEDVHWVVDPAPADQYLEPQTPQSSRPRNVARAATAIVPASFTRLCEFVVLHREPARFSLLYRLLWRLVHEPGLRNDPVDADMLHAQHMAHAVRRDIHKMKANLKLHPMQIAGREVQVACYEPAHHVVEVVAPWFAKRITAPSWAIFTPERCVRSEQGQMMFAPGVPARELPAHDASPADWVACFDRVFSTPAAHAAHDDRPAAHA
jgi:probable DNA metabolism protein